MKVLLRLFCVLFSFLFLVSCGVNSKTEIIKEHDSSYLAADACGLDEISFVPEGYAPHKYSTLYGIVYECEYRKDEKHSVIRVVPSEFTTTNLSGYTDTLLFEVYSVGETDYEIESREGVFACEFKASFSGKENLINENDSNCYHF